MIVPHAPVNGKVQVIPRDLNEPFNAAAGVNSNLTDMSKWIIMQMNKGKYGEGLSKQLFSKEVHRAMWAPQTTSGPMTGPRPASSTPMTLFSALALPMSNT
jgi:CubicO group peptidase (beta-lactamase class C family)